MCHVDVDIQVFRESACHGCRRCAVRGIVLVVVLLGPSVGCALVRWMVLWA